MNNNKNVLPGVLYFAAQILIFNTTDFDSLNQHLYFIT